VTKTIFFKNVVSGTRTTSIHLTGKHASRPLGRMATQSPNKPHPCTAYLSNSYFYFMTYFYAAISTIVSGVL